jgi:hypothetical protein
LEAVIDVAAILPIPNDNEDDAVAKREGSETVGAAADAAAAAFACLARITINITSPSSLSLDDDPAPKRRANAAFVPPLDEDDNDVILLCLSLPSSEEEESSLLLVLDVLLTLFVVSSFLSSALTLLYPSAENATRLRGEEGTLPPLLRIPPKSPPRLSMVDGDERPFFFMVADKKVFLLLRW